MEGAFDGCRRQARAGFKRALFHGADFVGACLAVSLHAPAAATDKSVEAVVIVGTRLPMAAGEGTDSVSVVTREQLDRMGAANAADLFAVVPGLQIDQLGGPGGLSSVYIRGSDPNHVLVLIDGVRVNDPTNSRGGGFDISGIDPAQIERIEVLRGGASAIYGADAMGGVISITTRKDDPGVSGALGWGGFGYRSASVRGSSEGNGLKMSTTASLLHDGRESAGGTLDLRRLGAAATATINTSLQFRAELQHSERDSSSFPDDSGGELLAKIRTLEQRKGRDTSLSVRGAWELDTLSLNAVAAGYAHVEDIDSPGVAPGVRSAIGVPAAVSHTNYRQANVQLNAVLHLTDAREWVAGVELQRENGVNRTAYVLFGRNVPANFDLSRDTRAAYAELKTRLGENWSVRLGARYDWVEGQGARTSPTIGLRRNLPTLGAALKATYTEGFRPPSFFALGLPTVLGGNPDLRAETSRGGSVGYEQSVMKGRVSTTFSLFETRYADLVTYDNHTNRLINADQARIRGFEAEVNLKPVDALRLRGVFTRLLTRSGSSEEPLRQRPGQRAGIEIDWAIDDRSGLNWRTAFAKDTLDSSVLTGNVRLPALVRTDLTYTQQALKWLSLSAAIDNVFDRQNQSYIGAVGQRRRLRLSAGVTL